MQDIDIYYESLRQVYEQISSWKKPKPTIGERLVEGFFNAILVLLIFSFLPALPLVLVGSASFFKLQVGFFSPGDNPLTYFATSWLILTLVLGIGVFALQRIRDGIEEKHSDDGPKQSLSPEQLTFIAVYEAYKELKIFFVSHIEQHITNSLEATNRIIISEDEMSLAYRRYLLSPVDSDGRILKAQASDLFPFVTTSTTPSFPKQLFISKVFLQTFEKYAWFQLDAKTKGVLQAIISFSEKIPPRLKAHEDLPSVLSIMHNFSKFVYAYLPEHKTYMNEETLGKLRQDGESCLEIFSKEVNELTSYPAPAKQEEASQVPVTWREKLQNLFYKNVFIRFTTWFVLILILTTLTVIIISRWVSLSSDTMVTLIIGTSVASAAALASFLPANSKSK